MNHLLESVRKSLQEENWYSALAIALIMPDVCSKLEAPSRQGSKAGYVAWFDRYLAGAYTRNIGHESIRHAFLGGDDCYALRCAYLHEADFDTSTQRASDVLDRFVFLAPKPRSRVHLNQSNTTLQLQVDIFCQDVCSAVEKWLSDVAGDAGIQARISRLPTIRTLDHGFRF